MIQLIRVYKDGRVIHAEVYEHNEYPPPLPPHERCRCIPTPIWRQRERALKDSFKDHEVTVTTIYPTTVRTT